MGKVNAFFSGVSLTLAVYCVFDDLYVFAFLNVLCSVWNAHIAWREE